MAYPYVYGWCQEGDVQARIKGGAWNPDTPGGITTAQLQQFISQAAAEIDAVLLRKGYSVAAGGGLTAITGQTIFPQVYTMLLNINATYAAGMVELWRHASDTGSDDSQAERLIKLADDMLSRIESDAVNLSLMGVAGPFEPEGDPSQAMNTNMDDPDPVTGVIPAPVFSIVPQQAVGYPQTATPDNPLTSW